MEKNKAHALLRTIVTSHAEALDPGLSPEDQALVRGALQNALTDITGLIDEIYDDARVGDDGSPGTADDNLTEEEPEGDADG